MRSNPCCRARHGDGGADDAVGGASVDFGEQVTRVVAVACCRQIAAQYALSVGCEVSLLVVERNSDIAVESLVGSRFALIGDTCLNGDLCERV